MSSGRVQSRRSIMWEISRSACASTAPMEFSLSNFTDRIISAAYAFRSITVVTVCALAALVSAQVTFSRDWSGGKRSPPAMFDCGQFARLCRHFLHELRQGLSEDKLIKHRRQPVEPEDIAVTYEDEK